ncbi:hypothetical protein FRC00_012820 [Tulasnella sp. 408]|nr:hypothetical protein FRC00_012820 [Tulasnella sp. 408]
MRIIVALAFSVGVTETATKTLINGCLQIFNLIMAFTSALFVDRIGRRKLFVISNAGMLLVFVGWTVTSAVFQETGSKAAGSATIAMIFIFFALYDIAYTPLLIAYTIEILPFKIRAKGFAAMSFTVTLGLIFNQYVNPVALEKLGWKYYLIYVGWLAFELGFIFLYLMETKGRTLEQTAMLFDGEPEGRNGDMMSIHDEERRPSITQSITRRLTFPKLKAAPSSDTMDKDSGSDDMEMKKSDWSKDANSGRDVKF